MYAIIQSSGRQMRVEKGEIVEIDRLDAKIGDVIKLDHVLMLGGDEPQVAPGALKDATVSATVLGHLRGKKAIGLRYKPKKFFRRRVGNRADLTRVRITDIVTSSAPAPASQKSEPEPGPVSSEGEQVKEA